MNFVGSGSRLTASDYARAAALIHVPVATLRGVVDVEAAGRGFDAMKRPKILPEPHIFYKRLGKGAKRDKAVKAGVAYAKWGAKPYPKTSDANYLRLTTMIGIDEEVAFESVSVGLPQIMGFNFKDAGYTSAKAMFEAFKTGEGEQLAAFVRLVDAWDLEDDLQRRDAKGFASHYNGAGYAKNGYDRKLKAAWQAQDRNPPAATDADLPLDTRSPEPAVVAPPVVPPIEAAPDPLAPITDKATVEKVQQQLREKGYYGVGPIDGVLTPKGMTESAILNFRNRNDLPLTPTIDSEFLTALASAPPIVVATERTEMSTPEVAKVSPELAPVINASWWQKVVAGITAAFGGIVANIGGAIDKLTPVKDFLGTVPMYVWGALIVLVAVGLFMLARQSGKSAASLYNKGVVT